MRWLNERRCDSNVLLIVTVKMTKVIFRRGKVIVIVDVGLLNELAVSVPGSLSLEMCLFSASLKGCQW
jgi:hypothetical protein